MSFIHWRKICEVQRVLIKIHFVALFWAHSNVPKLFLAFFYARFYCFCSFVGLFWALLRINYYS